MNNIDKIRRALSEHAFGAMLISAPASRLFATGFSSSAGALLISAYDAWFFVDSRYFEAAKKAISGAHVLLVSKGDTFPGRINAVLKDNGLSSVGFEDGAVTHAAYLEWNEIFEAELIPAQKLIDDLRAIKSRDDLEGMKKAQRLAEKTFEQILPLISPEISEKELAAELIYRMLKNGADDKSFDPIVVAGPRSSLPHGVPTDERIGNGFLTIDFGVRLDGWCSDTTRTLCVGKPDEEMIRLYDAVLKAQEAGIKAVRGGVAGCDVDKSARSIIEKAGYGEYFGHGFGHSIGLEVHESLRASQTSEDILPVGAVISAEPGIYLPGKYGARIEDVLYVTEKGSENITDLPKNLIVLH